MSESTLELAKWMAEYDKPWNVTIVDGADLRRLAQALVEIAEVAHEFGIAPVQRILNRKEQP